MSDKLKPCPFCGEIPVFTNVPNEPQIHCEDCGMASVEGETRDEVYSLWNARAAAQPEGDVVERVRNALFKVLWTDHEYVDDIPLGDFNDLTDAAKAAIEAMGGCGDNDMVGGDWLPISTAPRNGQRILACCPEDYRLGWYVAVVHFENNEWNQENLSGESLGLGFYPEFWKPISPPTNKLPKPPKG